MVEGGTIGARARVRSGHPTTMGDAKGKGRADDAAAAAAHERDLLPWYVAVLLTQGGKVPP